MKDPKFDAQRRQLLTTAGAVAVAIPVTALVGSRVAFAAMVDPTSAQAVALKYVETTATDGQMCINCALYQPDDSVDGGGNCPLFQGVSVGDQAWCSAWVAKS